MRPLFYLMVFSLQLNLRLEKITVPVFLDSINSATSTPFLNTSACPLLNLYLQLSSVLGLGRSLLQLPTAGWPAFTCGMTTMALHGTVTILFVAPKRLYPNMSPNRLVALAALLSPSSICTHFFNASTCQTLSTLPSFASHVLHSGLVAGKFFSLLQYSAS